MLPFPKPAFDDDYEVDAQINALRMYEQTKPGRAIPPKQSDRVLPATWNIANLGIHERRKKQGLPAARRDPWLVRPDRSAGGQRPRPW